VQQEIEETVSQFHQEREALQKRIETLESDNEQVFIFLTC